LQLGVERLDVLAEVNCGDLRLWFVEPGEVSGDALLYVADGGEVFVELG